MEDRETNTTTASSPYLYVEGPKQRNTFGILSFCFSTMTICLWSTLHFDIPTTRHSRTYRFFHRVSWMLVALLAPEALLCAAIHQRIDAATVAKEAIRYLPHQQLAKPGMFTCAFNYILGRAKLGDERYNLVERNARPRKFRFGLVHAFYATMGGFVFDTSCNGESLAAEKASSKPPTNTSNTRYVPTPLAFIYIMKHFPHIIPDLPDEFITDRVESNSLSKALLIIQVGWFCVNCASRLIQQLPLSLLEVSTAAHGLCTLLTYFVWWSKPLNVAEGTTMKGKEAREVHALLMCSKMEYVEALRMAHRMAAGDTLLATNRNEQGQIALAANALRHLLPISEASPPEKPFHHHTWMSAPGSFRPESQPNTGYQWISVAVAPILYGTVHFLGWDGNFPTPLERLVWHASSVVVTFSGLLWISLSFLAHAYFDQLKNYWARFILGIAFVLLVLAVIPLAYVLASGFLIIESIRQLFFLDLAAYQLASWSNYWPHFS